MCGCVACFRKKKSVSGGGGGGGGGGIQEVLKSGILMYVIILISRNIYKGCP